MHSSPPLILSIETATATCSAALSLGNELLGFKEENNPNIHAASLTIFIQQIMQETGWHLGDLDAIAVSKGPGSYTGLRIGVSTAKGLCYALEKPLIAVNTLKAMAWGFRFEQQAEGSMLLCPMIDARRMEVFTAVYDLELKDVEPTQALIVDSTSFSQLSGPCLALFGNGADKCAGILQRQNTLVIPGAFNSARFVAPLACEKFLAREFVDIAYFEPFYLKDFVSTTKKS